MENNIPAELDWVSRRAACSLGKMFDTLALGVESDVQKRQATLPKPCDFEFSFSKHAKSFIAALNGMVVVRGIDIHKTVSFTLSEKTIVIRDEDDKPMFEAGITFGNDGECRFKVGDSELEVWQVRKKALESLFFDHL